MIVIDTSVALQWCFEDEGGLLPALALDRLDQEQGIVPSLFFVELSNALVLAQRRGRLTEGDSLDFVATIESLNLAVDRQGAYRALYEVRAVATSEGLTSYDATYLELAKRTGATLATGDRQLREACRRLGVALLGEEAST